MTALPRVISLYVPEHGTQERFIGVREIRELFSVSDRHVRRWVSAGRFPKPSLKIGRMLRWKLSDVQAFIAEHAIE